jgi:hypothetical protein
MRFELYKGSLADRTERVFDFIGFSPVSGRSTVKSAYCETHWT